MKIKVLFFAELKEIFGAHRLMEVPEGLKIEEVVSRMAGISDKFISQKRPLVYAVNENFETQDKKLRDGDCLAIMTPMSGG